MFDWERVSDRFAHDLLCLTPKGALSHGIGWAARRRVPRPLRKALYRGFARCAGADLSALDRPVEDFERFDDFFTRPLPAGARPIAQGEGVVGSPVDGTVSAAGAADGDRLIQCKGLDYSLEGLLGGAPEAARFRGGSYATLYLAPRDYHRVHAPVDGKITAYQHLPGMFFPVNACSVRCVAGLFSKNERLVTYLDSDVGAAAVIMVAATGVGHITMRYEPGLFTHRRGVSRPSEVKRYATPIGVARGEEIGTFHLGSTVILLFEPHRVELELAPEQVVRLGEQIGRRAARSGEFAA